MTHTPSTAARLDQAVGRLIADDARGVPATAVPHPAERPLIDAAASVRAAFPLPPVAPRFEARLGARLSGAVPPHGREALGWTLRHPGRLLVTGAVGSAVTVGITAYAVWRTNRRTVGPAHRLLHR